MQRRTALAAACSLTVGLLTTLTRPLAAQYPGVEGKQLRACRAEADRRLPDYTYKQIQVEIVSRDQNVATVSWRAEDQAGRCTVTPTGRVLAFTRDAGSREGLNPGSTTRLTCESRRGDRQECRIPGGARIRLVRQLSDSPCRLNDTYGQGPGYLWVAEGCRGEFDVILGGGGAGGGSMRFTCESTTNGRRECPVAAGSQVRFSRQLSQAPCRLNDTYGMTMRYVWVMRGCRAEFVVTGAGGPGGGGNGEYTTRMVCESQGAARQQCAIAGATNILLIKQLSTSPCRLNETFGIGFGHIWASNGCRGEFEVTVSGQPGHGAGLAERVTCESSHGERAECRIRNGGQVQLIKQLSTTACVRNRTWGTGFGVIWVTKGCRGEFEVR